MNRFTIEGTNLIAIYTENGKPGVIDNITTALPYMDADMRDLAPHTISNVDVLTLEEYTELVALPANEV